MYKYIIGLCIIVGLSLAYSKISIVEVPLRLEYEYMKRAVGKMEFHYLGRLPYNGKIIAIPESEIPRFTQLAIDEGFDDVPIDDYNYLPSPDQAVGNTSKATITIENGTGMRFWKSDVSYFVTWDEDHPAPEVTLDGVPILAFEDASLGGPPSYPRKVIIKPVP